MSVKKDLKWIDLHKIVLDHRNQTQSVTLDDLKKLMLDYLERKYCYNCPHSKRCHEECEVCDDIFEVLERLGIEI